MGKMLFLEKVTNIKYKTKHTFLKIYFYFMLQPASSHTNDIKEISLKRKKKLLSHTQEII